MSGSSPNVPYDAVPITVHGRTVRPQDVYADDAERTDYITVSTYGPLSTAEEQELLRLQVQIQVYLGDDLYLCKYKPTDLTPIRALLFVRQVDVYRNKFKVVEGLNTSLALMDHQKEKIEIDILFHLDLTRPLGNNVIAEALHRITNVPQDEIIITPYKARMTVPADVVPLIAKDDRVRAIEEVRPVGLHNDLAREVLEPSTESTTAGFPDTQTYLGGGEVISVADTGFDQGDIVNCHPAFKGKVLELIAVTPRKARNGIDPDPRASEDPKYTVDDLVGHGTHVCGSALWAASGKFSDSSDGFSLNAKLVVSSLYENPGNQIKTPAQISTLFTKPYERDGSRIFTNSWGESWVADDQKRAYSIESSEIDDWAWKHKDAVILFSAGNDNEAAGGKPAIGRQAAARNVITVGACGSFRPTFISAFTSPGQMYMRSSTGPSVENVIKPDIIAPGVNVRSAKSQVPAYVAATKAADKVADLPNDNFWLCMTGTSQSTPLVAGCVAALREAGRKSKLGDIPAALIKAVLVNGALPLRNVPRNAQGFGRVNMVNSLAMMTASPTTSNAGYLIGEPLGQGERHIRVITVPLSTARVTRFKATLAYTDRTSGPGEPLQNNLNLKVTIDSGGKKIEIHGNMGVDLPGFDDRNNVEQVAWDLTGNEVIQMEVVATNIINSLVEGNKQPFALAWQFREFELDSM